MGLDMYAYTVPAAEAGEQQVDFDMGKFSSIDRRFAYWRKFNHLHGWMHRLYEQKGGKSSDFNCDTLRLTLADINQLEDDLNAKMAGTRDNFAATAGFFFGGDDWYEEDDLELRDFIARSKQAIEGGLAVIYDSWW